MTNAIEKFQGSKYDANATAAEKREEHSRRREERDQGGQAPEGDRRCETMIAGYDLAR